MRTPPTDTPRGSLTVLAVFVVSAIIITTVYFREGERGPLRAVRAGALTLAVPLERAGGFITAPARAVTGWLGGLTVSRGELETLRRQNEDLRLRNAELEEARLENERLRALVGFAEASGLETLGARIIGRPARSWEGALTISRGAADGVKVGMPVIAQQGLLGQVVQVSAGSARVRLITDQRSGVGALVQRNRAQGVVKGSIERRLTLEYVDRADTPRRGDVVITSGMGGVYPKGLLVGDVVAVELRPGDLGPRVVVSSAVPFDDLEEVLVLTGASPTPEGGTGE